MLLLVLTTLAATPSAAGLSQSRSMHGALVQHVQYQAGELAPEMPLSQMTREQLRAEQRRLEDNRPGIGAQITMIALGGATIFGGVIAFYASLILALSRASVIVPVVIGTGLVLGGGALLVIGIIMLRMALNERRPFNEEMDEIQQRLDGNYEEPGRPPAIPQREYEPVVPPPPPPPPAAGFTNVRPSLVLATF